MSQERYPFHSLASPKDAGRTSVSIVSDSSSSSSQAPAQPQFTYNPSFVRLLALARRGAQLSAGRKPQLACSAHQIEKDRAKLLVPGADDYYRKLPIQPGFWFIESLLKAPRAHIHNLEVNIPESLYMTDKLYFVKTGPTGKVTVTTDIHPYSFMQIVEGFRKPELSLMHRAAAVVRFPDEAAHDMKHFVLDWHHFKVTMVDKGQPGNALTQRFVSGAGQRPCLVRLHFFPYAPVPQASFAYFVNNVGLDIYRVSDIQRCVVDTSRPRDLEVFKLAGKALEPYERQARNLVNYLNKGYNVRVAKLVLDFFKDEDEVVWFSSCKALELDPSTLPRALKAVSSWWPELHLSRRGSQSRSALNAAPYIHCKLCRLHYTTSDLGHIVSVRMLMLCIEHITSRTSLPWQFAGLNITAQQMLSQTVRVCKYCYMLVTGEMELIQVERKLARCLNVPEHKNSQREQHQLLSQLRFLPSKLEQWRCLVLAAHLFEYQALPKIDGLHVHFRFGPIINSFCVDWEENSVHQEPCLILNLARVYYFYNEVGQSIQEFTENFQFEVRLSQGPSFTENILGSSVSTICNLFKENLAPGQAILQRKLVYILDSKDRRVAAVDLLVGLTHDKVLQKKKLQTLVSKQQGIYIASAHLMTTDPLPVQWMEAFGSSTITHMSFGPQIAPEQFYTPLLMRNTSRRSSAMQTLRRSFSSTKCTAKRTRKRSSVSTAEESTARSAFKQKLVEINAWATPLKHQANSQRSLCSK